MNEKVKEIIMLLLEPSTEEELRDMLKESCWSEETKECMRESLMSRKRSG